MTILERAIRRILIRNVDKTISTVGRNAAYDLTDYNPSLPTIGRLIINIIWFAIFTVTISAILVGLNSPIAYITPLLFIRRIIRPLAYNHIYGQKQEPVLVRDRRFRTSLRTEGYRLVKDLDNRIDFTTEQIFISKIEGLLKVFIALIVIFNIHIQMTSIQHRQKNLKEDEVLRLLNPGDTIFAKSCQVDLLVKVKETSYRTNYKHKREVIYESLSYETAYKDSLKVLGIFISKDTANVGSSLSTYLSVSPFHSNGWTYNKYIDTLMEQEITRADSLFYIKLSDATVSPSKLPPIK